MSCLYVQVNRPLKSLDWLLVSQSNPIFCPHAFPQTNSIGRRMHSERRTPALLLGALALSLGVVRAVPQIQSFSCAPGIVDVRTKDVQVTCALRVIDKVADIDYAYTKVSSPSGKFNLPLYFDGKKSFGLTSYTGANLAATFTIPQHAEPGYWQVSYAIEKKHTFYICGVMLYYALT